MDLLDLSFEEQWGQHLYQVREELRQEALQFVKEQRVRCLLEGSWFAKPMPRRDTNGTHRDDTGTGVVVNGTLQQPPRRRLYTPTPWRFARLSHNRRFLHYADFEAQTPQPPGLDILVDKIDLSTISSVVSNVSAPDSAGAAPAADARSATSSTTLKNAGGSAAVTQAQVAVRSTTKITILSYTDPITGATPKDDPSPKEHPVLTLHPITHSLASEWLDGLLMLLNQAPITAETNKLVRLVSEYGLKIRLLNVRVEAAYAGPPPGAGVVPSRDGLDDDYYYEV